MTQMKMELEYNLALLEVLDPHEINSLEDMNLTYLTGGKIARSAGEDYIRFIVALFLNTPAVDPHSESVFRECEMKRSWPVF